MRNTDFKINYILQSDTMNTLSTRISPLNLLPNDGQEQNDQNESTQRENEAHLAWFRPWPSNEHERVSGSRPLQAKPKYCYESGKFSLIVALFGILSTAISCVVWYLVLGVEHKCECSPDYQYIRGHSIDENFTDVLHEMKAKLQRDITDLSSKLDNFSKTLNDEQLDGRYPDAKYKDTVETLERLYNQTEEDIEIRIEQTNAKVDGPHGSTFGCFILKVDGIRKEAEKPNCVLKQVKQSKNDTLLTVHVPKSSEGRVTVAVTCSTTLQNSADIHSMIPSRDNQDGYLCYCKNKIDKQTDCVAYYWQCRL